MVAQPKAEDGELKVCYIICCSDLQKHHFLKTNNLKLCLCADTLVKKR